MFLFLIRYLSSIFWKIDSFSEYLDFNWDGRNLYGATYSGEYQLISTRNELMELITDLCQVSMNQLKNFS